jgi:putative chitinase
MRANEFMSDFTNQTDLNLDEDWKSWVAGAGLATMALGAGHGIYNKLKSQDHTPTTQTTQVAPKATPKKQSIDPAILSQAEKLVQTPAAILLRKVAKQNGITGVELAQFLAQCAHESTNFTKTKEKGDANYFKKYDIKYNPKKAKSLGNTQPGDGERYRGRGFLQLTGRYNYTKAGEALNLPLEQHPELVERPSIAAAVSIWYWQHRVAPHVDNFDNTQEVTRPINTALDGLSDRLNKFLGISYLLNQGHPSQQAQQMPQDQQNKQNS